MNQTQKERIETIKAEIRKGFKKSQRLMTPTGGQSCGMPVYHMVLESEHLEIEIKVGYHRSQLENFKMCKLLMELAMDDLIK